MTIGSTVHKVSTNAAITALIARRMVFRRCAGAGVVSVM
jgi:hypothetical protein